MASQEFLASFAVDIDEGGVSRLQSVLEENRDLANEVASAFSAATAAIREYQDAASGNIGGTGEPNRDTGSGQPAGNTGTKAGTNNTAEPDRTGWHYVEESVLISHSRIAFCPIYIEPFHCIAIEALV